MYKFVTQMNVFVFYLFQIVFEMIYIFVKSEYGFFLLA